MAATDLPSQNHCSASASRRVRIAETRSVACCRSARVARPSASALAREPLDARQADQGRAEQAIAVSLVTEGIVDPSVVGGELPPAAAGCPARVGSPGDRRGHGLGHQTPRGARDVSLQGAEPEIRAEGSIPQARTAAQLAESATRRQALQVHNRCSVHFVRQCAWATEQPSGLA